jgi:hypothetical protein
MTGKSSMQDDKYTVFSLTVMRFTVLLNGTLYESVTPIVLYRDM